MGLICVWKSTFSGALAESVTGCGLELEVMARAFVLLHALQPAIHANAIIRKPVRMAECYSQSSRPAIL
jgi:hypothetical protein